MHREHNHIQCYVIIFQVEDNRLLGAGNPALGSEEMLFSARNLELTALDPLHACYRCS